MAFQSFAKPARGTHWREGRERRAKRKAAEDAVMREARARDGNTCRWPRCEFMRHRPTVDVAHLVHRGMGGNPAGDRTQRHLLLTLCRPHHGMLDQTYEIDIEPMDSARGTDGPLCFYKRSESGRMEHVFTESRRTA